METPGPHASALTSEMEGRNPPQSALRKLESATESLVSTTLHSITNLLSAVREERRSESTQAEVKDYFMGTMHPLRCALLSALRMAPYHGHVVEELSRDLSSLSELPASSTHQLTAAREENTHFHEISLLLQHLLQPPLTRLCCPEGRKEYRIPSP